MNWSAQQLAIFEWFGSGKGSLCVRARAGTGKTTTILSAIEYAPEQKILLAAFNKRIQVELSAKLRNPRAEAKTLHSLGFAYIRRQWAGVQVDSSVTWDQIKHVAGVLPDAIATLVHQLVGFGKNMAPYAKQEDLVRIALERDCMPDKEWEDEGWTVDRIASIARQAMAEALKPTWRKISFDDMVYVALVAGFARPWYNMVVVDECFPGDTPILLADKTTLKIGEIVEKKLPVSVLAYDEKTGQQVSKQVIGWKKTLLQKKTFRLKVRRIGYAENGERLSPLTERVRWGTRSLVCTEDHKVFANGGWIQAKNLQLGDVVQLESGAPRDASYNHKYKHAIQGKEKLKQSLNKRRPSLPKGYSTIGPTVRGGNGTGPTIAEALLLESLGNDWHLGYVVATGKPRGSGFPTNYKIDLANPGCKIAVELDGASHQAKKRQEQDAKKVDFLKSHGWTVLRFKNLDVIRNTTAVLNAIPMGACPVKAEVIEIEEHAIDDYYVYDLTIEDVHCYYAHGILVHNCQDMNAAQIALARKACKPRGRIVVVGDDRQAIYGFRGADSGSIDRLKAELSATECGLTITYRCPKEVVTLAQRLVPDYQAAESAPVGQVDQINSNQLIKIAQAGNAVLSRKNAPLMTTCLAFLRAGVTARIEGRDIGKMLLALVKKQKANSIPQFLERLVSWKKKQEARATKLKNVDAKLQEISDQYETLVALADGAASVNEIEARCARLFEDSIDEQGRSNPAVKVVLSSVHKAKGLEWERVFLLDETFLRNRPEIEEANIEYVAITRAKMHLTWVVC